MILNLLLMLMSVGSAGYGIVAQQTIWVVYAIWLAVFMFGTQK